VQYFASKNETSDFIKSFAFDTLSLDYKLSSRLQSKVIYPEFNLSLSALFSTSFVFRILDISCILFCPYVLQDLSAIIGGHIPVMTILAFIPLVERL
jgi:hypothetical protein